MNSRNNYRSFVLCFLFSFSIIASLGAYAQKVAAGHLIKHTSFASEYVGERDFYVWTPSNYSKKNKYDVLYMHDGEMLFDSLTTWNKQEWQMDEIATKLMNEGKTNDFIIVGIPCSTKRFFEYFPQKALNNLSPQTLQRIGNTTRDFSSDNYLRFLVKELKPFIDKNYSTRRDAAHTFAMGSSMGGLISLYAICEYPEVFGGVACMSIHTPMIASEEFANENLTEWAKSFRDYLNISLPKANSRKIYIDRGDKTLDASYVPYHQQLADVITAKGWKSPFFVNRFFPGAAHMERDWSKRVAAPLQFLLSDEKNERINKIDPPMWWCGMKNPKLQLMVYGNNIAMYTPGIDYEGVTIDRVVPCESANYLIIYLDVKNAVPGSFDITFSKGKKKLTYKYQLKERSKDASSVEGFSSEDVLYLIMPDRFANGNYANDNVKMSLPYDVDRNDITKRHGGDLEGIEQHLDYLQDLGVTTLWLNPVLENDMGEGSYHGYAATDYYKVDPRLGTNEDYKRLTKEMHSRNMKMVMDMVFNHCGSEHVWLKDMPMSNWFNTHPNYVQTNHNKGVFYDPYASDIDKITMTDGWFVPSMPDFNQRNEHVATYLIQNSIWWIEYVGLNGIRQDTYPYADKEMMERWCKEVFEEYPNFNIVGESWITNPVGAAYWQRGHANNPTAQLKSTMDFHLQSIASTALHEQTNWNSGMQTIFEHFALDFCYPDIKNVLRFLENHDTDRFFKDGNKSMNIFKQSMALLLTIPGIPQLYYAQELMTDGSTKKDFAYVRPDMQGGWKEDKTSVFDADGRTAQQQEAWAFSRKLLNWRKDNKIISDGSMKHYIPMKGVYVYERRLNDKAVMVILNGMDQEVTLPLAHYKETIKDVKQGNDIISGSKISLNENIVLSPRDVKIIELF